MDEETPFPATVFPVDGVAKQRAVQAPPSSFACSRIEWPESSVSKA